jgi:hypothetical protein
MTNILNFGDSEEIPDKDLTIPMIKVPEFKPYIMKKDLEDFNNRDTETLFALNVVAQKVDWLIEKVVENNAQMREQQRSSMQLSRWQKSITLRLSLISGVITFLITITGGTVGGILKQFIQSIFK